MSARRAARLVELAGRHPDRSRAQRRSWQIIAGAAGRGDPNAINAVLRAWLQHPDDERWEMMTRWRKPQALAEKVVAAALEPDRPAAQRTAIGAFLTRHRLVPDNAVRRALFYVLTGQPAQHRALDPDGSLLAAAYRAVGADTRAALREVIARAGHLDLVRVVAGAGGAGRARMTTDERVYLVGQLAGRADWSGMWRPADARGRDLFALLSRVGPAATAAARDALPPRDPVRLHLSGWPAEASFSPDGHGLAVAEVRSDLSGSVSVFELPGGRLAERYERRGSRPASLLHLGDAVIVWWRSREGKPPVTVMRYAGGQAERVLGDEPWGLLARHRAGFVALFTHHAGGQTRFHLRRYSGSGEVAADRVLTGHDLTGHDLRHPWLLTTDPAGGRLLIGGPRLLLMDGNATRVVATGPLGSAPGRYGVAAACLPAAATAVTIEGDGHARSYLLVNDQLEMCASAWVGYSHDGRSTIAASEGGEVAVIADHPDGLRYYGQETLTRVEEPRPLAGSRGTKVWTSPDRRYLALGGFGRVDVAAGLHSAAVAPLADRPLAELAPADLAAVTAAMAHMSPSSAGWPFLDLLRSCLEHTFAADVEVAATALTGGGEHDIALAAGR